MDAARHRNAATAVETSFAARQPPNVARCGYNTSCPLHARRGRWRHVGPITYILPDLPWAVLLEPILHQAPPGATIIVYTAAMRAHVEQAVHAAGRGDLVVHQVEPPPSRQVA